MHARKHTHAQTLSSMSPVKGHFLSNGREVVVVSLEKEEPESVSVPTAMPYNNVSMGKSLEMRRQPIVLFWGTRVIITNHLVHKEKKAILAF